MSRVSNFNHFLAQNTLTTLHNFHCATDVLQPYAALLYTRYNHEAFFLLKILRLTLQFIFLCEKSKIFDFYNQFIDTFSVFCFFSDK